MEPKLHGPRPIDCDVCHTLGSFPSPQPEPPPEPSDREKSAIQDSKERVTALLSDIRSFNDSVAPKIQTAIKYLKLLIFIAILFGQSEV